MLNLMFVFLILWLFFFVFLIFLGVKFMLVYLVNWFKVFYLLSLWWEKINFGMYKFFFEFSFLKIRFLCLLYIVLCKIFNGK